MEKGKSVDMKSLESVNGGKGDRNGQANSGAQYMPVECPNCHRIFNADVSKDFAICEKKEGGCGYKIEFFG
ncbi:MAG: hypothetical protein K5886_03475 [Lachnospiraceae bacterium]|nr:hypothetical protein [Lachnospiraceae bacterium]